jgi:hypothetical protein
MTGSTRFLGNQEIARGPMAHEIAAEVRNARLLYSYAE